MTYTGALAGALTPEAPPAREEDRATCGWERKLRGRSAGAAARERTRFPAAPRRRARLEDRQPASPALCSAPRLLPSRTSRRASALLLTREERQHTNRRPQFRGMAPASPQVPRTPGSLLGSESACARAHLCRDRDRGSGSGRNRTGTGQGREQGQKQGPYSRSSGRSGPSPARPL